MEKGTCADIGALILRVLEQCEPIFAGKIDPIEVLLQDDGLKNLYDYQRVWDCRDFFELLGHAQPTLKILEIGAGTGATTASVLGDLVSQSGERMYSAYTFTDLSAGFFASAKEKLKEYANIDYAVLDISKDPIGQGFEEGSYDLIVASNVSPGDLPAVLTADGICPGSSCHAQYKLNSS